MVRLSRKKGWLLPLSLGVAGGLDPLAGGACVQASVLALLIHPLSFEFAEHHQPDHVLVWHLVHFVREPAQELCDRISGFFIRVASYFPLIASGSTLKAAMIFEPMLRNQSSSTMSGTCSALNRGRLVSGS